MHSKSILSFHNMTLTSKKFCITNYLAAITLGLALLICAYGRADAHSLVDNSIHGNEHHNNNQQQASSHRAQGYNKNQVNPNGYQNRCQSGWIWFNNKCWVTTQSRRDFAHAIDLCKKMHNSTLPTIHSEDENEFLRQNIDLQNSPIWLYARHNHQYNKTRWLDKSGVNYTRWDNGQPSDKSSLVCIKTDESWFMKKAEPVDGQTECVSFWEDAKWGTQVGCLVLLPVVCERKLPPISRYSVDGSENPITSQSEQQQMYPVSGSITLRDNFNYLLSFPLFYLVNSFYNILQNNQITSRLSSTMHR